jgi:mannose-6-phosphate isomerase-like protein (cupin superfamily)
MGKLSAKTFDQPDEVRTPDKAKVDVVDLGDVKAARMTLQPGWRWSECIKPVVGTETCQIHHVGVVISGRLQIEDDGESGEIGPGEAYQLDPGHDAWVVGDEPFVAYEFDGVAAATYALPQS